ncbi:hypothetical protein QNN00_20405 [Bacillus velezensis]|nr:hypothetical protein [Bacillus velezensis]
MKQSPATGTKVKKAQRSVFT